MLASKEVALKARQLVQLQVDAPLPALGELVNRPMDDAALRAFLAAQGFNQLITLLGKPAAPSGMTAGIKGAADDAAGRGPAPAGAAPPASAPRAAPTPAPAAAAPQTVEVLRGGELDYHLVDSVEALEEWAAEARAAGRVAVEVFASSTEAQFADLTGLALAVRPGRVCYVPINHDGAGVLGGGSIDAPAALGVLRALLADPAVRKIGYNMKLAAALVDRFMPAAPAGAAGAEERAWERVSDAGPTLGPLDDVMLMSAVRFRSPPNQPLLPPPPAPTADRAPPRAGA